MDTRRYPEGYKMRNLIGIGAAFALVVGLLVAWVVYRKVVERMDTIETKVDNDTVSHEELERVVANSVTAANTQNGAVTTTAQAPKGANQSFRCYGEDDDSAWCVARVLERTASVAGHEQYVIGRARDATNDYVNHVVIERATAKDIDLDKCKEQIGVSRDPVYLQDVWGPGGKIIANCGEASGVFGYCSGPRDIDCSNKVVEVLKVVTPSVPVVPATTPTKTTPPTTP